MFFRYVDLFILNTHNIVESRANVTYHPSRLMGINDIHNAVSFQFFFFFKTITYQQFMKINYNTYLNASTFWVQRSKILFTPYNFCNYAICKDIIVSGGVWVSPCQMPIGSSITLPALSKFYTVIYFEILHNSFPDWSDVSWKFLLH